MYNNVIIQHMLAYYSQQHYKVQNKPLHINVLYWNCFVAVIIVYECQTHYVDIGC